MLSNYFNVDAYKSKQAFKVALAATLATLMTLTLHMPHPFWAPAIVIMLLDDYTEGALHKGMTRFLSTIAGAAFAYFLGHFTIDSQIAYYLSMFIVVSIVIYGNLVSSTAWLNFGVTFLFLTMYMMLDPAGSFDIAIWRSSEILTGVFCSVAVSLLFFPSNLINDIKDNSHKLATFSQQLFANILENDNLTWKQDKADFKTLLTKLSTLQGILNPRGKQNTMSKALTVLMAESWAWWRQCGQIYELLNHNPNIKDQLKPLIQAYIDFLKQLGDDTKDANPNNYKNLADALITTMMNHDDNIKANAHFALIQTWLITTDDWLTTLQQFMCAKTINPKPQAKQTVKEAFHALYIKLNSKKSLLPHCFSISLGCCLVTYVWLLTGWPGGVCAGISALVVGADSSLTKINLKIRLRLIGSFIGSALGLIIFIFFVHNTFALLLAVFAGIMVFAYQSQNGFSAMYISWMASMGYVLTVVPDITQTTDITFPFERAFGLIMGLIVMAFVVNFFWPLNYKKQYKEICDNTKKKMAIIWSLLNKLKTDNFKASKNDMMDIQKQLLMLIDQGSDIAKPNNLMKNWMPVVDVIVTLPWVSHYITADALTYLTQNNDTQWQDYTQQTYEAVLTDNSEQLQQVAKCWDDWAKTLDASTDTENKKIIVQCWLMMQANERFCSTLAKCSLYDSENKDSQNSITAQKQDGNDLMTAE